MLTLLLVCTLLPAAYAFENVKFKTVTYETLKGYWTTEMADDDVACASVIDVEATFYSQRYVCKVDDKFVSAVSAGAIIITDTIVVKLDGQDFSFSVGFVSANTAIPLMKSVESDGAAVGFALMEIEGANILLTFDAEGSEDEDDTVSTLFQLTDYVFEGVHDCLFDGKKAQLAFRGPTWTTFQYNDNEKLYFPTSIGVYEDEEEKKELHTFDMLPVKSNPEATYKTTINGDKTTMTNATGTNFTCTKKKDSTDSLVGNWWSYDATNDVVDFIIVDAGGVFYQVSFKAIAGDQTKAKYVIGSYTSAADGTKRTLNIGLLDIMGWAKAGAAESSVQDYHAKDSFVITMASDGNSFTSGTEKYEKVQVPKATVQFLYLVPEGTTAKAVQDAVVAKTKGKRRDVVVVIAKKKTRSEQVEARVAVAGASTEEVNKAKEITVAGKTVTSSDPATATSNKPPGNVANTTTTAAKKEETKKKSASSLATFSTFSMAVLVLCALV
jgi:hypothetical protein